ncbi:DUF6194 family protein [Streptomyces pacificus]|uniref:DUF6194 domain-containing protein n=1 Tax=Streptomyces pacificus TaxID=2705029 RepID=A0A6A0ANB5_9ACTN|nr:DUF6194 family protein [Streptomyces pacificus]GFH34470.1 hypothetical protein SCWH03_06840 [Streptomyces pacificus]
MSIEQIIAVVRGFDGALVIVAEPGGDLPEPAWGDAFCYYAPDGQLPRNVQPYATAVTRNQPGDTASDLDPPHRWRVNVRVDRAVFEELTGEEPRNPGRPRDYAATDRVMPHPVYGALGWISVVNPGAGTRDTVLRLLRDAHEAARARFERRGRQERPPGSG